MVYIDSGDGCQAVFEIFMPYQMINDLSDDQIGHFDMHV